MRFTIKKYVITIFEITTFDKIIKESMKANKAILDSLYDNSREDETLDI